MFHFSVVVFYITSLKILFLFHIPPEKPRKEGRKGSPVHPVVLPPNLHLLTLSIPGWNFSSNHSVHLSYVTSGRLGDKRSRFLENGIFVVALDQYIMIQGWST